MEASDIWIAVTHLSTIGAIISLAVVVRRLEKMIYDIRDGDKNKRS